MATLAQAKAPEVVVLNSVAASAADLTVSNGKVSITGMKPFVRKEVDDNAIVLDYFLNETLQVQNVFASTFTVGTEYSFYIYQDVNGELQETYISYVPTSTSNSAFATGLTAAVNAAINSGRVKASAATYNSGGDYGTTITALTGYAVFTIEQKKNVSSSSGISPAYGATTSNGSLSGTVLTLTKTGHGLAVGDLIKYTWTSGTLNGVAGSVGIVARVMTAATADTLTINVTSSASYVGTAASSFIEKMPSARRGNGADLLAQGYDVTSGNTYHKVTIIGSDAHNGHTQYTKNPVPFQKELFVNAGDGDALDLMTRINQVKGWLNGSGNFDPNLLS